MTVEPSKTETACCVVGAGPAGVILALLLARRGVAVTLLEAHDNFDRDFRGDTIHPSVLELLDEIGLAAVDAAEAANVLTEPLTKGTPDERHLREVQCRRERPTRLIQALQTRIQRRVIAAALDPRGTFGLGFKRVRVER